MQITSTTKPNAKSQKTRKTPIVKVFRQTTTQRKRKIEKIRVQDKANRDRSEERKIELKIATEQRLAASALAKREHAVAKMKGVEEKSAQLVASREAKAKTKAEELKAKAGKEQTQFEIQTQKIEKGTIHRTFAGSCAVAMVRFSRRRKPSRLDEQHW